MSKIFKVIDGVRYMPGRPEEYDLCKGCAAENDIGLCNQLSSYCDNIIWVRDYTDTAKAVSETKRSSIELALCNQQQLARAIQQAGGSISILEHFSVTELLETLAKNNIIIKATYER